MVETLNSMRVRLHTRKRLNRYDAVAVPSLYCCGLTPRTRLNAVLSANGLP